MKKNLAIILDAAHGKNVPGKRSPDNSHFEYAWSRLNCSDLYHRLKDLGYEVTQSVIGDEVPMLRKKDETIVEDLGSRVSGAENWRTQGKKLLISLHNNAASIKPVFSAATGVEVFTWPGQSRSDEFAEMLIANIGESFPDIKLRSDVTDGDKDKEERFKVLSGNYWAVIIEWLFMDNKHDLVMLKDRNMDKKMQDIIINSIEQFNELV